MDNMSLEQFTLNQKDFDKIKKQTSEERLQSIDEGLKESEDYVKQYAKENEEIKNDIQE